MAEATKPSNSLAKNECQWTNCVDKGPYSTVQDLVDHVNDTHLSLFVTEEFVLCLWEGCKVYNIPCQNKSWLPQHMRRHTNERPHKCIMNGCNMSFWNPDSLQNHLQLHLAPSPPKVKKKSQKRTFMSSSHISDTLSGSCNLPKKMCSNDLSTLSDDDSSSQSDFRKFERKRPLCLKVKIPLHSSIKFSSVPLTSPVPIPINGGVIHDDIIDLKTMSVIQSAVVTRLLQSSHDRISRKDSVCLKGKIIGQRKTTTIAESEYLVRWRPMLIPDTWVPVSEYQELKFIPLSDLSHCQKSALVQNRFLTADKSSVIMKHKRKRDPL